MRLQGVVVNGGYPVLKPGRFSLPTSNETSTDTGHGTQRPLSVDDP